MGYKRIVCLLTGSNNSLKAALEAAHVAGENRGNLIYVYAWDGTFLRSGMAGETSRELTEKEEALASDAALCPEYELSTWII
jgi:hypothetical protein